MSKYYKGDDFDAFDEEWVIVEFDIPEEWVVSKAKVKIGNLPAILIPDPNRIEYLTLDSSQSASLKDVNACYAAIYDERGRKKTLEGSWTFVAEDEVVE